MTHWISCMFPANHISVQLLFSFPWWWSTSGCSPSKEAGFQTAASLLGEKAHQSLLMQPFLNCRAPTVLHPRSILYFEADVLPLFLILCMSQTMFHCCWRQNKSFWETFIQCLQLSLLRHNMRPPQLAFSHRQKHLLSPTTSNVRSTVQDPWVSFMLTDSSQLFLSKWHGMFAISCKGQEFEFFSLPWPPSCDCVRKQSVAKTKHIYFITS